MYATKGWSPVGGFHSSLGRILNGNLTNHVPVFLPPVLMKRRMGRRRLADVRFCTVFRCTKHCTLRADDGDHFRSTTHLEWPEVSKALTYIGLQARTRETTFPLCSNSLRKIPNIQVIPARQPRYSSMTFCMTTLYACENIHHSLRDTTHIPRDNMPDHSNNTWRLNMRYYPCDT